MIFTAGGAGGEVIVPGEPISSWAVKAPLTPTALRVEIAGSGVVKLPSPAALSNETPVVDGAEADAGQVVAAASKTLTASPPALRPTPEPL